MRPFVPVEIEPEQSTAFTIDLRKRPPQSA
jgi:hypothetical protein